MATIDSTTTKAVSSMGCACGCAAPVPRASAAGGYLSLVPALALVLLPKCPLCIAAYLGVFGFMGAGSWLRSAWGLPLGAGLLALAIGALALRARRSGDHRPPLVGFLGAAALLAGKFALDAPLLLYLGMATLIAASLWSARLAPAGRLETNVRSARRPLIDTTERKDPT